VFALAIVFLLTIAATQAAQSQTFKVIHTFTGGQDGARPDAGLTMDAEGNLYGTASFGGGANAGTVYRLKRLRSNWVFNPLYSFTGSNGDGATPQARVIFGPDGVLYGTTEWGGGSCKPGYYCGTVFDLRPSVTACKAALCPWTETVLYSFSGGADGGSPEGDLIFDSAGNIYGTTVTGGNTAGCFGNGCGTVYELKPSGGGWTESVLYAFAGGSSDGQDPWAGVTSDGAGNLYGTTVHGGSVYDCGTVFQLTQLGGVWTENILNNFQNGGGCWPYGDLIFDQSGNLYGDTTAGFAGTVFEMSLSGGVWTLQTLYSFTGCNGCGPYATLAMDGAGNLYGTTAQDGANDAGNVFKLTPSAGGWTYTSLHDFTGGSDGAVPYSSVLIDSNGNLYGTTYRGGAGNCASGCGVVWEITP
jgi:uncharacterized repeat protein (TIGR03803 family)